MPPRKGLLGLFVLNNSCGIPTLGTLRGRFDKLNARKAMVHHYSQYVDEQALADAAERVVEASRFPDDKPFPIGHVVVVAGCCRRRRQPTVTAGDSSVLPFPSRN